MFELFGGPQNNRNRLHRCAPPGPLKDYLAHPLPDKKTLLRDIEILAVDYETTGLDAKTDQILSIGYVTLTTQSINLSTATHHLIKTDHSLPSSTVVIHKITDDQITHGKPIETVLTQYLSDLKGKVLLAHHAKIESMFLEQACKQVFGCGISIPVIDTMQIEARRLADHQHGNSNLNLTQCSTRYNLPRYKLHDALSDALSCAQLFLAQIAHDNSGYPLTVGRYVNYLT